MLMKNNFQSKAVPRGTRTIWRYLSALFILFTFAIGNVWAADPDVDFTMSSSTKGDYFKAYTVGTNTVTISTSAGSISSGNGGYYIDLGSNASAFGSNYLGVQVSGGATISKVEILASGSGNNKSITAPVVGWEDGWDGSSTTADAGLTLSYTTPSSNGSKFSTAEWREADVDSWDATEVRIYKKLSSVTVTGYTLPTTAETIRIWGVRVYLNTGEVSPVCPSGLSITSKNDKTAFLEGDAIELTAALTAGNGTITYQWYKGGTAEGNKLTGKTAAKLEIASCVEGDAGDYYCVASKSDCSDAVNADAFTITVAHNPCATHHWFVATADATANGKTNWDGFTNAVTGSSGQTNSVTIDGTTYNLTKRTGSTGAGGTILGFTIPANKAGTLYGYMKSSGSAARILSLKKGDDVVKTNTEIVDGAWTLITIDAIAPGTYTLSPDQNVQVQMFVLKICDATFHTITLDLDGGTGATSIQALDGVAATKPADPTKDHCAFAGWYSGVDAYDWTTVVTAPFTLTAHWTQLYTISFANGGGSGDAPAAIADKAQGETFQVPANTFTAPSASQEFDIWNDGTNDYAPGATYTVGTENVILTAQWKALVAKYTVIFKDGETTLDTKLVDVGSNPSDAGVDKTKALSTFAAWQKDAADIALDDAFWATVAANAEITLTARWTKAYATDVDFETEAVGHAGDEDYAKSIVDAHNYALSTKTGTTFDENTSTNNGAYLGLKIKNAGTTLSWNVVAGKVVELKAGVMVANGSLAINSGTPATIDGGSTTSGNDNYKIHYFYSATEALYEFTTSNGSAEVIKAITMRDPYTVSFEAHGDADPSALPGQPSVTLPAATNGTASLLGWFDAETGGNKIGDAGDSYTPTANITLHAQWEAVSTDARLASITFSSDAGTLSPAFNPEVVNYTYTMPYPTAAVPTITGATSVSAKAKTPVIDAQAANWGDVAHVHGVAESDDTKDYYITMKIAPKDGVSIIKVATTGGTNKTVTGLYAGDGDVNLSSNTKMDNGKYIGFTLDGTTLQAGDRINVHTTEAANTGGSHIIFYDNMTSKTELYETGEIGGTGDNIFEINAAMVGSATAYVYRANNDAAHQWNGKVDFIEVTRAMNPVLTAITIDGRAGEIDALNDHHFSVLIPYEADLAALTVVPTIVRNAPHATTPEAVISNEGAWILGDNTYRIMDKDGDYNDYTITLDRDVLKHTVSFNTHGGSAVASEEVVHGEYLAAAPAAPTKDENVFKFWSETEDGAEVDVTTVQINADKEFHAVWEAEPAGIKLFNGNVLNTTNFISAAATTIEISEVEYPCLVAFASNRSSLAGAKQGDLVMYSATTDAAKIKFDLYNANSSAKTAYVWVVEEGDAEATQLDAIEVAGTTRVKTAYYEFNGTKNRTVYLTSGSKADIKVLQAKVIESGSAIKQFGDAGYTLKLNQGRIAAASTAPVQFEGATVNVSSDYAVLNNSNLSTKSYIKFTTTVDKMILHVEKSGGKFYVSQDPEDKGTIYNANTDVELTPAGEWYLGSETSGSQIQM